MKSTSDSRPAGPGARLRRLWAGLFRAERATLYELLLFALLLDALRDSWAVVLGGEEHFRQADAFGKAALAVRPVAWAAWMPVDWVLSWSLTWAAAAVTLVSAGLWLLKRGLPWTPLICVIAQGLQASLFESTTFNYTHRPLPAVAVLIVFAAFYLFRRRSVETAIRDRALWTDPLYPRWVFVLVLAYLGFQYTYSGLTKLVMGGTHAGSGLSMQLLVSAHLGADKGAPIPWFAEPLLRSRTIAGLAMTCAVVLETGAVVAFSLRWVRPVWAMGLLVMHVLVIVTLHIPFIAHMLVLAWIALVGIAELPLERWRILPRAPSIKPSSRLGKWLADATYRLPFPGFLLATGASRHRTTP